MCFIEIASKSLHNDSHVSSDTIDGNRRCKCDCVKLPTLMVIVPCNLHSAFEHLLQCKKHCDLFFALQVIKTRVDLLLAKFDHAEIHHIDLVTCAFKTIKHPVFLLFLIPASHVGCRNGNNYVHVVQNILCVANLILMLAISGSLLFRGLYCTRPLSPRFVTVTPVIPILSR